MKPFLIESSRGSTVITEWLWRSGARCLAPRTDQQITIRLVLAAISVRLLAVFHVEAISVDGVLYCRLAELIEAGKWLQSNDDWFLFNPYPALIAFAHHFLGLNYEIAGQLLCAIPAACAVLPLYLWCRDAFGRRSATLTAWIYVVHPMLIRSSAEVMREGIYWFFMFVGIQLAWSAVMKADWRRFVASGLFATLSTLVRIEGFAVFVLLILWSACAAFRGDVTRRPLAKLGLGTFASCLVFPLTLLLLNVTLLPAGMEFRGLGRFRHLIKHVMHGIRSNSGSPLNSTSTRPSDVPAPIQRAGLIEPLESNTTETATSHTSATAPVPRTVQQIVSSIPVWNTECVVDPDLYCLRNFLILADQQREALFIGQFLDRFLQGYKLPVLVWLFVGLRTASGRWFYRRDLPLLFQTLLLVALVFMHLSTEYCLQSRYLFCMMPFVLPWAGYGMLVCAAKWQRWCRRRGYVRVSRPALMAFYLILMAYGIIQGSSFSQHNAIAEQRDLGLRIQGQAGSGHCIVCPENLQPIAHYSRMAYYILPTNEKDARDWIERSHPMFIVLESCPAAAHAALADFLQESQRYIRLFESEPRYREYLVLRLK